VLFLEKHTGTRHSALMFLQPIGFAFHVVNSGPSGPQNIDALFFILHARYRFDKMGITECILVRPRRETSMQYFSRSGGPGAVSIKCAPEHVTANLCFCIRWDLRVT
jgi:hypothetical protein